MNQSAQEEHRAATKAKSSTADEPKFPKVSWCKSSITINGKTQPMSTTKEYNYMSMQMSLKGLELNQVVHIA